MAEIAVPTTARFVDVQWDLDQPAQVNRSAWTGRRKVMGLPGAAKWYFSGALEPISTEVDARPWRAFKISLRGPVNSFRMPIACSQHAFDNPIVRTGPGDGNTIPLEGLPPSTTMLVAGQFMTVPLPSGHKRLVCLIGNLTSNGLGQGTATFLPALNEVPTVGATVETIDPYALVALTASRQGWQDANGLFSFTFEAEEAL